MSKWKCIATRRRLSLLSALICLGSIPIGTGSAVAQEQKFLVLGGGSTFAAPIFEAWIAAYRQVAPSVDVSYDVIGSGEGITRFLTGSLDFGATDAPLTDAQEAQVPDGVIHVPVTAGMISVAYNLPGDQEGELRLSRELLGDIFAGTVKSWDDPRIAEINPDLDLPRRTIYVVARQDGSGTTFAFTNHLNAISETWRAKELGVATLVDWPGGAMLGRGNEGVAANLLRADGTIGYVTYGLAVQAGLPSAALENASGAYVAPSPEAGAAAIASAVLPDNLKIDMPDPAGADAYPIVTFTWSLLRRDAPNTAKAEAIAAFTRWAISDGQALAPDLYYVPMPEVVRERAGQALAMMN